MEKDLGKIKKNENTDILIRIDDFGGKAGLTIREYTTSERYTGFTKSGTRIPAESIKEFKEIINSINDSEVQSISEQASQDKSQQQLTDAEDNSQDNSQEIKEEAI